MYRIVVTDEESDTTVFELAGPAVMVARLAPSALAEALGSVAEEPTAPGETAEAATQRRKRRTKAEMEAARAAENMPVVTSTVTAPPTPDAPYNPFGG